MERRNKKVIDIDKILEDKINKVDMSNLKININEIIKNAEKKKNKMYRMQIVSIIVGLILFIVILIQALF